MKKKIFYNHYKENSKYISISVDKIRIISLNFNNCDRYDILISSHWPKIHLILYKANGIIDFNQIKFIYNL